MYSKGGGGGGVGGTGVFVPEKKKEKKGEFLKHRERCNKIMGGERIYISYNDKLTFVKNNTYLLPPAFTSYAILGRRTIS